MLCTALAILSTHDASLVEDGKSRLLAERSAGET